jgi:glycosyltransferase involved in cell wall biosynthesis
MERDKINVCIVRHSFYPFELNVKREAETLSKNGFAVSVICLRGREELGRETVNGVEVFRMPVSHKRGKIWRYVFEYNAFFMFAFLKVSVLHFRRRFRVVQVNTMPDALVFSALIPKLFGARVILHLHEPMPELFRTMFTKWYSSFFIWLVKLAEKVSLRFADKVLTVTREMRDNFGKRGADVNKITVVVNVPDDELFRVEKYEYLGEKIEQMKRDERQKGIFRVLSHGAIEERYGYDLIVKAVHIVKKELPGVQFRFMGKGDYLDEVLRLARELRVSENVRYLGFLPFEQMVEEILTADACLVPVQKNPYSNLVQTNKMYEYIALGKAVIASRLDAVLSYFPEDCLFYFEPGNAEEMAERIFYVFAHPEEAWARLKKTQEIYETYRWEREKKKYLGVYRSVLSS